MSLIIAIALVLALSAQSEAPQTELWSDPEVFRCGPSVVRPGDTLVLSKQANALRELAVLRPGASIPHVLVVDAAPAGTPGLMSPEQLASATEVRLTVADLLGLAWREEESPERVFSVAGVYEFRLSTRLESEEGAFVCRVRYQPSATPASD